MDRDGTKSGFDLELLKIVNDKLSIPVIASGGAGTIQHCIEAITISHADAVVLAASIFNTSKRSKVLDLKEKKV